MQETDQGFLQITGGIGSPQTLYLNDSVLANTTWQLVPTTGGILQTVGVSFMAQWPKSIQFTTLGGFSSTITVQSGILQATTPIPAPVSPEHRWEAILPGTHPLDSWYAELENIGCELTAGSINIPYWLAMSVTQGNSLTESISRNAVVFSEPEWGFDATGTGKSGFSGMGGMGGPSGGLTVAW